jgi:hypothetical protein
MRIAWRWVLPVVPLLVFVAAGYQDYARDRQNPHMQWLRAHYGENFSCFRLWGSREVYEDDLRNGWGTNADCFPGALARYATLLNLPGFITGGYSSLLLLKRFDLPMAAPFYGIGFSTSFAFWYAIGAWTERRRRLGAKAPDKQLRSLPPHA